MNVLRITAAFLLSASSVTALPAMADIIGVATPVSGPAAILGTQLREGAEAAMPAGDAGHELSVVDTGCSPEGGAAAARQFVEQGARIVVGFICTEAIEAALPILTEAQIPVLAVGVRADRLTDRRERTGHLVWRIAPRSDEEARAVAELIAERWTDQPFGFIEDGSIANRALIDTVRRLLGDEGLEPSTSDNYRPAEEKQFGLARRLARTGVTRFFVAGDRPDIAVILRDAGEIGLDLSVIGGESLLDETSTDQPLPEGVVAVLPPIRYPELAAAGAGESDGGEPGAAGALGYFGPAYAAIEIAVQALEMGSDPQASLSEILSDTRFETRLGPVSFDDKGDAALIRYAPMVWRQGRFREPADG